MLPLCHPGDIGISLQLPLVALYSCPPPSTPVLTEIREPRLSLVLGEGEEEEEGKEHAACNLEDREPNSSL